MYIKNLQTIPELKAVIAAKIRAIPREELLKTLRVGCKCVCGGEEHIWNISLSVNRIYNFHRRDVKLW